MVIRLFALAFLIGAAQAQAAPKKHKAAPPPAAADTTAPETIDVDAMARAKDAAADATAAPVDALPDNSAAETESATPPASAESDASKDDDATSAGKDEAAPASTAASEEPGTAGSASVPPLLAPAPDEAEKRLAAACEARATSLLDAAQKGDYATAIRDFDAKRRSAMPAPKFKQAWESLDQFGTLTARGQVHAASSNGYIAITIPLIFEKANLYVQVVCGSDGRIAGFYIKPLEIPQS